MRNNEVRHWPPPRALGRSEVTRRLSPHVRQRMVPSASVGSITTSARYGSEGSKKDYTSGPVRYSRLILELTVFRFNCHISLTINYGSYRPALCYKLQRRAT